MIPDWIRKIPHPEYGNWGGQNRTDPDFDDDYVPAPYDAMDEAFMFHDLDLREAKQEPNLTIQKSLIEKADHRLGVALRGNLKPYLYPDKFLGRFYGSFYHNGAKLIFRL